MTSNKIVLTGSWEKSSRNPLIGAFILVFICGGLYFFIASFILQVYVIIDSLISGNFSFSADMNLIDYIKEYYRQYKHVSLTLTAVFQYLMFLVFPVIIIKKWHTSQINEYFQYHHLHVTGILLSVLGVIFIIPIVFMISQFFYRLFPVFERLSEITEPLLTTKNPVEMLFTIFVISITPAVCEEAIFRGYFQRTLQRKLPFPWHFIISGFVFALFHQHPFSLLALFLVGTYLGFIYYCYSSIYVSMAAHCIYNLIVIIIYNTNTGPSLLFTENGDFHNLVILFSLILFLLLVFLIYMTRMKTIDEEMVYPDETV